MNYWLSVVFAGLVAGGRHQTPLVAPLVDIGESIGEISPTRAFEHPDFPLHSIRIKEQNDDVCDAGSKQYTGWLDFNGKHIFFWYFDSLNDPQTDPLTLWLTGGPGVSSMVGMLLEVGPCRVDAGGRGTLRNPHSWTRKSSMIFVDQPVGTGLSYTDPGVELPSTSSVAAEDLYIFLQIFLTEVLPERRQVPFHIAGESYAGHYIPALSTDILQQNRRSYGKPAIPLKSILVGNGYVSPLDTVYGYYETLCTTKPGVDEPVFNQTRCQVIAESLPRCLYIYEACYRYPDEILCRATDQACGMIGKLFHGESHAGGRDPFDITRVCEIEHLCYAATLDVQRYINEPATRRALQVPEGVNFSIEAKPVSSAFESGNDLYTSVADEIQFTLENGVDVLIYNGNLDLACNTAGNLRWTSSLRWNGQAGFTSQDLNPWFTAVDGGLQHAGSFKEVFARTGDSENRRLAFVTVDRAGHMVPFDQPAVALDLYERWLFRNAFA